MKQLFFFVFLLCMRLNCIAQNNFHIDFFDKQVNELYDMFKNGQKENLYEKMENLKARLTDQSVGSYNSSQPLISSYKRLALLYSVIGDNNSAIDLCNMAIMVLKRNEKAENESNAELLGLKCKYQRYGGFVNKAIESGLASKKIYDSLNIKSNKYAELMSDLAGVYGLTYNYEKSIELQSASIEIFESTKDWLSLAETYNNISNYYQRAERLADAERFIKKAISLLNEHDDANKIIRADAERLGDSTIITPFALNQIKRRLDYDRNSFHQSLAKIYQIGGKIKDAINTEKDIILYLNNMGDDRATALHLMILAQYLALDNQFNSAKECVELSFKYDNSQFSIANGKILLSHMCFEMGDTIKAIQYAKESRSYFISTGDINHFLISEYALSLFYWKSNDYLMAEQYLSESLDLLKTKILNEFNELTNQQKQRIWAIYEKYFIFYRHIIEKSNRNDVLLSKLFNYVLFSKSLLLDSEINSEKTGLSRLQLSWQDVQQSISNNAIAIEFISTMEEDGNYNTYHALIIDKSSSSPRMITLYNESKLEEMKKTGKSDIRNIVGELIWKPILAQYPTVKDIYFSPDGILHMLPIEYYSADGLNSMFEHYNMYRLSSTKEIVRNTGNRHPNSAVLYGGLDYNQIKENASESDSSEVPSMWRGIADRGGFDPLYNTAAETQEIKNLLTDKNIITTLYSGETGTEESFRNLSGHNHSIIHLATHGMYIKPDGIDTKKKENNFDFLESLSSIDDPVKEDVALTHSFLVMAGGNRVIARESVSDKNNDGILTSKEISQLNLHGLDIVVLSACESALGDVSYGGVYGLQRGFKKAGANTIVMSLDKVDDEATRILMVEFYRNMMNGKTKRQSLKDAQQYLRKVDNGKYDDTQYWASFIMLDGIN